VQQGGKQHLVQKIQAVKIEKTDAEVGSCIGNGKWK
jgi:ribosomal protein L21